MPITTEMIRDMREREKKRASVRASLKKRRERLKAEGKCVDCAAEKPKDTHTVCDACRAYRRNKERESRKID